MNTPTPEGRVGRSYRCKVCRADVEWQMGFDWQTGRNHFTGRCDKGHDFDIRWKPGEPVPDLPVESVLEIGGVPV